MHALCLVLQRLPQLQTVALETRGGHRILDKTSATQYSPMNTSARVRRFAVAILVACGPTLRQASVAIEAQDASARPLSCMARREAGVIRSKEGTTFDFEAVSQFWKPF
jgi:hypothetical protein